MIVDVTCEQPAVMLLLGIRAVVRRGVTITITTEELTESKLSKLPFNIQETKIISLATKRNRLTAKKQVPKDQIIDAISAGISQSKKLLNYLDLPAYEAVRGSRPSEASMVNGVPSPLNTFLLLCSFHKDYDNHWDYLFKGVDQEALLTLDESLKPVSMLDISSPRLVGQALYEHIRWSRYCLVDWTKWSANVFFELGVRLACSNNGAICMIEESEVNRAFDDHDRKLLKKEQPCSCLIEDTKRIKNRLALSVVQREQLIQLFQPTWYTKEDFDKEPINTKPIREAFANFRNNRHEETGLAYNDTHNDTYQTAVRCYDWTQERILPPHIEIRANIEARLSEDREKAVTDVDILFSENSNFISKIRKSWEDQWKAAWYYFRYRYLPYKIDSSFWRDPKNKDLVAEMDDLGRAVLEGLTENDENERIILEIEELIYLRDEPNNAQD